MGSDKSANGWTLSALALPLPTFLYFYSRHQSLSYFVAGLCVLFATLIIYWKWEILKPIYPGKGILIALMVALPSLGMWQFLQMQDPGDIDQASYTCWFWNMERLRGYSSFSDFHIFAAHSNYALVFWLPLHYLGGEIGIKAGKLACILAAVWLVVRGSKVEKEYGAWTGVAILLAPPIASQFFFGFQPEFMAAPFVVLAMHAYRDARLGRFLAYSAFISINKEVFTMVVAGILLVALIERRPWKWILFPGFLCCAIMGLYWYVIGPAFSTGANHFNALFPNSLSEVLARIFRIETAYFFLHVVFPFLPLMLVFPKRYLLVPLPLLVFYAVFHIGTQDLWRHYTYPFPFLCAAGLIMGSTSKSLSNGRVLFACAVLSLLSYPLARAVLKIPSPDFEKVRSVHNVRALIPDSASVIVNGSFIAWFAARKEVMAWEYKIEPLENFDYVVLDRNFLPAGRPNKNELDQDIHALSTASTWTQIYAKDELYLFQKSLPLAFPPASNR